MHKFKVGKKVYFEGSQCEITQCLGKNFYYIKNISNKKIAAYEHELTTFNFELGDIVKHMAELDVLFEIIDFVSTTVKVIIIKGKCRVFSDKKFYLFDSGNLRLIERKSELTPEEWFAKHEVPKI